MSEKKHHLADGKYDCFATLYVKNGKVLIELHSTFGLEPGTTLPLLREKHNLLVEKLIGSEIELFNGHVII